MKPLSPDDWSRLKDLFGQAIGMDENACAVFLRNLAIAEPLLARELTSLLHYANPKEDFLEKGVTSQIEKALYPPTKFPIGERIEGFEILEILGEGSFGCVYRAKEIALNREVALKVSPDFGEEGRLMAPLEHEHIVRVFSQKTLPELQLRFMCMQYIQGVSLQTLLDKWPPSLEFNGKSLLEALERKNEGTPFLSARAYEDRQHLEKLRGEQVILFLINRVAEALALAHTKGILHLDVKPANILITHFGRPLLTDFNVGLRPGDKQKQFLGGTLAFMSPEQLRAYYSSTPENVECIDGRSDIYSLGLVLKKMGTTLLKGATSAAFNRLYEKATEEIPGNRYPSAHDFSNYLSNELEKSEIQQELPRSGFLTQSAIKSPVLGIMLSTLVPEIIASVVQISYNNTQIVGYLSPVQQERFRAICLIWNPVIYSIATFILLKLFDPIRKFMSHPTPELTRKIRQKILNYPLWVAIVSTVGWAVGSVLFPIGLSIGDEKLSTSGVMHFAVSFVLAAVIALTYSYLYMEYVGLRVFYPQAWISEKEIKKIARQELGPIVLRHKFFYILAGLIPLLGATLLVFATPQDHEAFKFWISAFIGLGMLGVLLTVQLSAQMNRVLFALVGRWESLNPLESGRY